MTHLTTVKLDTSVWRGTHVGFLVNFQDKLREYERLTDPVDHYSDEMKRTLLMQTVSAIKELDSIKTQCQFEIAQGRAMPDFAAYTQLVRASAAMLDQRLINTRSTRSSSNNAIVSANMHAFNEDPKDY